MAGAAFFAGPVKYGFKHIEPELMFTQEMPFNLVQKAAVYVEEAAAGVTFQVKMFTAI
jgi:hypothetical protein